MNTIWYSDLEQLLSRQGMDNVSVLTITVPSFVRILISFLQQNWTNCGKINEQLDSLNTVWFLKSMYNVHTTH